MTNARVPDLRGLGFPFRIVRGSTATADGAGKIEQNLRHLLEVRPGERPMLRAYGAGIRRLVQAPNDGALRALARLELETALRAYMPEVVLTAPLGLTSHDATLTLTVEYRANPRDVVRRLSLAIG